MLTFASYIQEMLMSNVLTSLNVYENEIMKVMKLNSFYIK